MINILPYFTAANTILNHKVKLSEFNLEKINALSGESLLKKVTLTNFYIQKTTRELQEVALSQLTRKIGIDVFNQEMSDGASSKFASVFIESFSEFLKGSIFKPEITLESYNEWLLAELEAAQDMDLEVENAIFASDIIALIKFIPEDAGVILAADLVADNFSSEEIARMALDVLLYNLDNISVDALENLLQHMAFEGIDDDENYQIDPIDFIVTELDEEYDSDFLPRLAATLKVDLVEAKAFIEGVSDKVVEDSAYGSASSSASSPEYKSEIDEKTVGPAIASDSSPESADSEVRLIPSGDPRKREAPVDSDDEEYESSRGENKVRHIASEDRTEDDLSFSYKAMAINPGDTAMETPYIGGAADCDEVL